MALVTSGPWILLDVLSHILVFAISKTHVAAPWPTLDPTPTDRSSSCVPSKLLGWTESTSYLERYVKCWVVLEIFCVEFIQCPTSHMFLCGFRSFLAKASFPQSNRWEANLVLPVSKVRKTMVWNWMLEIVMWSNTIHQLLQPAVMIADSGQLR